MTKRTPGFRAPTLLPLLFASILAGCPGPIGPDAGDTRQAPADAPDVRGTADATDARPTSDVTDAADVATPDASDVSAIDVGPTEDVADVSSPSDAMDVNAVLDVSDASDAPAVTDVTDVPLVSDVPAVSDVTDTGTTTSTAPSNALPPGPTGATEAASGAGNHIFSAASGTPIIVTDPDSGPITTTVSVTGGALSNVNANTACGGCVLSPSTGSGASVIISGTVAQVNAALDGLTYSPCVGTSCMSLGGTGSTNVTLTVTTDDGTHAAATSTLRIAVYASTCTIPAASYAGRRYVACTDARSAFTAESICPAGLTTDAPHLTSIGSAAENAFLVASVLTGVNPMRIGLFDSDMFGVPDSLLNEGCYQWLDPASARPGTPSTCGGTGYSNWRVATSEPTNDPLQDPPNGEDCTEIRGGSVGGLWATNRCLATMGFLCELPYL